MRWSGRTRSSIHAVFGGKNPHPDYLVGGVPCSIDADEMAAINTERLNLVSRLISQADEFVNEVYIPDLLAVASFYKDWAKWGGGFRITSATVSIRRRATTILSRSSMRAERCSIAT